MGKGRGDAPSESLRVNTSLLGGSYRGREVISDTCISHWERCSVPCLVWVKGWGRKAGRWDESSSVSEC